MFPMITGERVPSAGLSPDEKGSTSKWLKPNDDASSRSTEEITSRHRSKSSATSLCMSVQSYSGIWGFRLHQNMNRRSVSALDEELVAAIDKSSLMAAKVETTPAIPSQT
jgi:hypothetical protein